MTGRDASSVRSAVAWAVTHEPALFDPACVEGVYRFFETTSRLVEGQDVLVRIADRGPAIALTRAGQLAVLRGDLHAAESMAARALRDIAPADAAGRAVTRMVLAQATTERGHPLAGRHHLRAALVDARLAGDLGLIGRVFNNLSAISVERGRLRDAERQLAAALTAKRRGGAGPVDCGRTLFNLAEIALEQGRLAAAARAAAEAAHLLRAGGYPRLAGLAATTRALALLHGSAYREALAVLAEAAPLVSGPSDDRRADTVLELRRSVVQHAAGELRSARESLRRALPRTLGLTARDRDETARALSLHAWYLAGRDPGAAARLLGAATRLGTRALPAPEAGLAERAAAAARAALGAAEFEGAHRAGAGLDRDALIALADRIAHVAR